MPLHMFKRGQRVKRNLEGLEFFALVVDADHALRQVILRYLDDDNIEEGVPFDEIEVIDDGESKVNYSGDGPSKKFDKSSMLSKPLAGLVDDDYEIRQNHKPTVYLHQSSDDNEAIILNAAENRLAAGGGLRALRYLKK